MFVRVTIRLICWLGCLLSSTCAGAADDGLGSFIVKSIAGPAGDRNYALYVPANYSADKSWPLILFLHGAGQRGDDGLQPTEVGLGRAIRENPERFPCLVLFPQCPRGVFWNSAEENIEQSLRQTLDEYSIDSARIYLTGISMGGMGCWSQGAKYIDRWAALMPICGGGDPGQAERLARVPIRVFHGAKDRTVPVQFSRKMVQVVQQAGGQVAYVEFPEAGHNSWDQAYGDPASIQWLLSQRRPSESP